MKKDKFESNTCDQSCIKLVGAAYKNGICKWKGNSPNQKCESEVN